MATAEFSKFAGILSAALSQHHLCNSMSKEQWLHGCRRVERSYSTFKVRRGGSEEISLVQGKRNPSKMVSVARGHQRADTLKP